MNLNTGTRFAHIRRPFKVATVPASAATIAFRDGALPNTVEYAIAFCSSRDQFSRRHGRGLAEVRLDNRELAATRERLASKVGTVAVSTTNYRAVVDAILADNRFLTASTGE